MKYLIEVEIPSDHILLHRPHINIEDWLKEVIGKGMGILDVVEIKVSKKESPKKKK